MTDKRAADALMRLDHLPAMVQAHQEQGEELCGFLYGDEVIMVLNVHEDPGAHWLMDAEQQMAIMKAKGMPDAVWHTHPGGTREASERDLFGALPEVPFVVATFDWVGVYLNGKLECSTHDVMADSYKC